MKSHRDQSKSHLKWPLVTVLSFSSSLNFSCGIFLKGILLYVYTEHYHFNLEAVSAGLALLIITECLGNFVVAYILKRDRPLPILLAGGLFGTITWAISPYVTNLWQIYFVFLCLGAYIGLGDSMLANILVNYYFSKENQPKILAIIYTARNLAAAVLPWLVAIWLRSYSLRWITPKIASVMFISTVLLPLALLKVSKTTLHQPFNISITLTEIKNNLLKIIQTKRCIITLICFILLYGIIGFCMTAGFSHAWRRIALVNPNWVAICQLTSMLPALLMRWVVVLIQRWTHRSTIFGANTLCSCLGLSLFANTTQFWPLIVGYTCFTCSISIYYFLLPLCLGDKCPRPIFSSIHGMVTISSLLIGGLGPLILAWLFKLTSNYSLGYNSLAVLISLNIPLIILYYHLPPMQANQRLAK